MKLNITPGPWEFVRPKESNGYVYVNACGDTTGGTATCYNGDLFPDNAAAIVTAVNNTYHKGINPEAVPEMLAQLKNLVYNTLEVDRLPQALVKQLELTIKKATL